MQVILHTNSFGTPSFQYAKDGDAGIDLQAFIEQSIVIRPNEVVLIPTGVQVNMDTTQMAALILPRSGLGHKKGLIMGNGTGVIDSGYQGVMQISAWNRSETDILINPMERIAQVVFVPVLHITPVVVESFDTVTERGDTGFGSSGV
jgi:dUTP pyrophosphatase